MPNRSSKKRPRDLNELAAEIVAEATSEALPVEGPVVDNRNPAAVALGRQGGLKGGKARAERTTAEERSAAAKKAAEARWRKNSE